MKKGKSKQEKKIIKNERIKYNTNEDENIIRKLIIITIVVMVAIAGVYLVTELLKKDETKEKVVTPGVINYDKLSVGTLLNRNYKEYYVLVYDSKDEKAVLYSTLLNRYMSQKEQKDYVKIYYCDLDNKLNKEYYNVNNDDKSNPKAENISELDFGKLTLLKVKNGKIVQYVEAFDEIKDILK